MPTPLIIIITLFILNWIIRILIRKNPQNKSLIKVSFLISFSMIAYTIYYFVCMCCSIYEFRAVQKCAKRVDLTRSPKILQNKYLLAKTMSIQTNILKFLESYITWVVGILNFSVREH